MYDSKQDTEKHIEQVRFKLNDCISELKERSYIHDASKLVSPEKEYFDKYTPLLATLTYGTQEYKDSLEALKPALEHHYAKNSHHPEHYESGVDGMDLFDVMEMLCDWKAATMRTSKGDIKKSLEINRKRFNLSDQLYNIMLNTIEKYDFLNQP